MTCVLQKHIIIQEKILLKGGLLIEPLKQWICDVCGEIIEKPEDGYVIWRTDKSGKIDDMRIVHHNTVDDDGTQHGCDNLSYPISSDLTEFIGPHGITLLLSLLDPGPEFLPEYQEHVGNMRSFVELFRRLHIPYYEEARVYWSEATYDDYFADANEIWTYSPSTLKELIEKYKDK